MSADGDTPRDPARQRFTPDPDESANPNARSLAESGSVVDDWLAKQMGTSKCVFCGARKSPAELEACERQAPGRNCPEAEDER